MSIKEYFTLNNINHFITLILLIFVVYKSFFSEMSELLKNTSVDKFGNIIIDKNVHVKGIAKISKDVTVDGEVNVNGNVKTENNVFVGNNLRVHNKLLYNELEKKDKDYELDN